MLKCGDWPVGICSWSLQKDITGVAEAMKEIGLSHVNLAVRSAVEDTTGRCLEEIKAQNWTISSTMLNLPQEDYSTLETIKATGGVVPDDCWQRTRELFSAAVDVTAELGAKYILMHMGFIDESDKASFNKLYERVRHLADVAGEKGLKLLMETGQETAEELRRFLEKMNHPAVVVNFDPANIILYDKGDPIESVKTLAPWVRHIHIKDAIRTDKPGTWGTEVPWGQGQVGTGEFLETLKKIGFEGVLAIEREAGDDRFGDIKMAAEMLSNFKE